MGRCWVLCATAVAAAGCTHVQYPGPRRPRENVAIVEGSSGIGIHELDGRPIVGGTLEILPGPHVLSVTLTDTTNYVVMTSTTQYGAEKVCFGARPGHSYLVRPNFDSGSFRPEVIDTDAVIPVDRDCNRQR